MSPPNECLSLIIHYSSLITHHSLCNDGTVSLCVICAYVVILRQAQDDDHGGMECTKDHGDFTPTLRLSGNFRSPPGSAHNSFYFGRLRGKTPGGQKKA